MTSRCDNRCGGFTLLELLAVLAILGLVVSLVASARPAGSANADIRLAAGRLASAMREARSRAIAQDRSVGLLVDVVARRFGIDNSIDQQLPPNARILVVTVRGDVFGQRVGRIGFYPDGSSSGGRIDLKSAARTVSVAVDWLSGQVSIVPRP